MSVPIQMRYDEHNRIHCLAAVAGRIVVAGRIGSAAVGIGTGMKCMLVEAAAIDTLLLVAARPAVAHTVVAVVHVEGLATAVAGTAEVKHSVVEEQVVDYCKERTVVEGMVVVAPERLDTLELLLWLAIAWRICSCCRERLNDGRLQ